MTFMDSFLEKNRHLHLLDACCMYEEQLLKQEKELPETLKMIWVIVEDSIKEEKKKVQALKEKVLNCVSFWELCVPSEGDKWLWLKCIPKQEDEELWSLKLDGIEAYLKGDYIYKEVFNKSSAPAGSFTVTNTEKKVFRAKISDLPEIDQGFVKEYGCCLIKKEDHDKVALPKWEEVSKEQVGHEYPDEDQYGF